MHRLRNQRGFTIMEVLVASMVFITGFGIVILVLNGTLVKLSTKELTLAQGLAQEYMEAGRASEDLQPMDTLITRSDLTFRISRTVSVADEAVAVRLRVIRPRQERQLVDLYYEYSPNK